MLIFSAFANILVELPLPRQSEDPVFVFIFAPLSIRYLIISMWYFDY